MEKVIPANYGSIPHLSISKLNQKADKKITENQEKILTEKARDYKDLIIVTEKLDGSNVGIYKKNDQLIPLTRKGYTALSSPYKQHYLFYEWVMKNQSRFNWLPDGWRIAGEWLLQVHGTKYDLNFYDIFYAFDIFDSENKRLLYLEMIKILYLYGISTPNLIHIGSPIKIETAYKKLQLEFNDDTPEGVVYRCERNNEVDFLAKYVRENKEDGKYMKEEIFNDNWKDYFEGII